MSQGLIIVLLGFAFVLNIISFLVFLKKEDSKSYDDVFQGEFILIHKSTNQIMLEIYELKQELMSLESKLEPDDDVISKYSKQGMNHADIAKAMNKSVKEIDLIMKMRGNR